MERDDVRLNAVIKARSFNRKLIDEADKLIH